MRFRKSLKLSLLLIIPFLVAPALAQQYQILRADYGAGNQRVDVTKKLQQIAAANRTFRMGNSTFGVDPAPGVVKSLRIFTRDSRGGTRTFEYREGSTVDGALFTGWSGGGWPGGGFPGPGIKPPGPAEQYQIVRADYGAGNRWVDVTQKLRMIANSNQTFKMGNSTFGVDPAPGQVKTLRIFARDSRGGNRTFEYREGSMVDGAQFTGWTGGSWSGLNLPH